MGGRGGASGGVCVLGGGESERRDDTGAFAVLKVEHRLQLSCALGEDCNDNWEKTAAKTGRRSLQQELERRLAPA